MIDNKWYDEKFVKAFTDFPLLVRTDTLKRLRAAEVFATLWSLHSDQVDYAIRLAAALSLVLGGAAGNLWDRLTLGHVVDFIQVHAAGYYWPAFNVADSAITVGVTLIIWDGFRDARKNRDSP